MTRKYTKHEWDHWYLVELTETALLVIHNTLRMNKKKGMAESIKEAQPHVLYFN